MKQKPYFNISLPDAVAMLKARGVEVKPQEILSAVEDPLVNIGHVSLGGKVLSVTWEDVAAHFAEVAA